MPPVCGKGSLAIVTKTEGGDKMSLQMAFSAVALSQEALPYSFLNSNGIDIALFAQILKG